MIKLIYKFALPICISSISLLSNDLVYAQDALRFGVATQAVDGRYDDSDAVVLPLLKYEKDRLTITTLKGSSYRVLELPEDSTVAGNMSLLLSPRLEPNFGTNSIYSGIDRKSGLDGGLLGNVQYGAIEFEFRGIFDLTGAHDGFELSAEAVYQLPVILPIRIGLGVRHRDANLNQYLYGVDDTEATESRTAFQAAGATTSFALVNTAVPLAKNVFSFAEVSYENLGNNSDSPLVVTDAVTQLTFGIIYQWK